MSDDMAVDHHVKKKKRKTGDVSFSEHVSYSEHTELEGSGKKKKKKKHRSTDDETVVEVSSSDNLSPSYSHNRFTNCETQEDSSQQDSSNRYSNSTTRKSPKKNNGQQSLYDSYYNEVAVSEEALLSEPVRKKKKKHRTLETRSPENSDVENSVRKKKKRPKNAEFLKEDNLGDVFPQTVELSSPCMEASQKSGQKGKKNDRHTSSASPKMIEDSETESKKVSPTKEYDVRRSSKKKKAVSAHKALSELATGAICALNDEREPKTVGCLSPKVRSSPNMTVTDEMFSNENTVLEDSGRKKKKRKHRTKEDYSQTESSICSKLFKKDTSPLPSREDDAVAEESGKEEAFENITEQPNGKTNDDNVGTPAKTKKSAKHKKSEGNREQDVTAELEESDKDEVENTVDEEASGPKKKISNRPKQSRRSGSVSEVLCSLRQRDVALLEDYFPKIRSMTAKTVSDVIGSELKRIKEAKAKGIKYGTGRFDSTEDELIKKNVEDFKKLVGLESGEMLFHSYRFPDKKATIEKLKKKYHFRQRIAKGIARTVAEVYNRGSKLFDLSGNKGRFTKEEVQKLQKALPLHGNKWTTVGHLIGRNSKAAQLKASQLRRDVTGGKWSIEEVNRLLQAVKECILRSLKNRKGEKVSKSQTVPKEMLFSGIPWAKIEEKVKTRNWAHCKSKWNDVMLIRMNDGISPFEGGLGSHTSMEMIKWLHAAKLPKGQVNWMEMAKAIGNVPPGILQQKVYKLKSRNVPDWQSLSFQEIVDYLYTEVLPKLEIKAKTPLVSQDTMDMPERKDKFLINDIFKEYVGDDKKCLSISLCSED